MRPIPELPEKPRILIVRLSAIGDTVHTLPLAAALRKARPGCFLGWAVEKPSAALLENNPLLNWVRVLPKGWLKSPGEIYRLRRDLRQQNFDLALDPQGLSKSAVAILLSGAGTRLGFTRPAAREIAPLLYNRALPPQGTHAVDRTLSLLCGLGLEAPPPGAGEFVLPPPTAADRQAIASLLAAEKYRRGFVLMGPWGSFPAKLWPLERFRDLALGLRSDIGLPSLILGHGEKERAAIRDLAARAPDALAAAPDLALTGVAELARRATCFVGCDSFPMHAAAAVGCRTFGLFGVTDPARLGPYGPKGKALFNKITLPKSTRERRRLGPENMLGLGVGTVLGEICGAVRGHGGDATESGR